MERESELLEAVLNARKRIEEIDTSLSEAKEVKEKAEMALIEYMDNHELKNFRSSAFKCLVMREEPMFAKILPDKQEEALRWLEEDCGRPDMLRKTVHHKTLTSFISARIKKGEPMPEQMFKYYFKPTIVIRMG